MSVSDVCMWAASAVAVASVALLLRERARVRRVENRLSRESFSASFARSEARRLQEQLTEERQARIAETDIDPNFWHITELRGGVRKVCCRVKWEPVRWNLDKAGRWEWSAKDPYPSEEGAPGLKRSGVERSMDEARVQVELAARDILKASEAVTQR